MAETNLLRERYARSSASGVNGPYSFLDPAVKTVSRERELAIVKWLRTTWHHSIASTSLLEIGCGTGQNLLEFLKLGFNPGNMVGIDLLPDRISEAREKLPIALALLPGDARELFFPGRTFDVVFQSTVFSSILDPKFQEELAQTMWDWAAPGGGVLWYDFVYDNPSNKDVAGISVGRVKQLFPQGELRYWRITLAPPLARFVTRIHPGLYALLNLIPFLRTHVLCWIQKPLQVNAAAVSSGCLRLSAEDADAIADVHLAAYGGRLLTEFGRYTVARYYCSHLEGVHAAGAIGIEREGELIGFCVMVKFTDLKPFLFKNFAALFYAILRRPSLALRAETGRRSRAILQSILGLASGSREEPGVTRILSIAVHPAYQNKGYGRQLLQEAARMAAANGNHKLALTVHAENTRAIKIYERDGWIFGANSSVSSFVMEKNLTDFSDHAVGSLRQ